MLLAVTAAIYAVGHGLAALAPEFWSLLSIRTVTMFAAALFTPQAAATVGLLVPPERRSEAIAFIFIGWSLASVVGIPLEAYWVPNLAGAPRSSPWPFSRLCLLYQRLAVAQTGPACPALSGA
jgi:MFS family permease